MVVGSTGLGVPASSQTRLWCLAAFPLVLVGRQRLSQDPPSPPLYPPPLHLSLGLVLKESFSNWSLQYHTKQLKLTLWAISEVEKSPNIKFTKCYHSCKNEDASSIKCNGVTQVQPKANHISLCSLHYSQKVKENLRIHLKFSKSIYQRNWTFLSKDK